MRWMFGFQRRLVRTCECDTDMPQLGPFPHTSQTAAIGRSFVRRGPGSPRRRCQGYKHRSVPPNCRQPHIWPVRAVGSAAIRGISTLCPVSELDVLGADEIRRTVVTFRDAMRAHAPGINRLNVYPVPDGDTGTNMARTLDAVVAELDTANEGMESTCKAISHGSLMGARGNSGVILSQILRGFVGTINDARESKVNATHVAEALKRASGAAYEAVLKPIEGTILTVVRESADAAAVAVSNGATLSATLRAARDAGRDALARTPEMLPVLKDAGVVDAGGAGFLLLLDSAIHVVDGEPMPEPDESAGPSAEQLEAVALRHHDDGTTDVSELRYEVMFFLDLEDAKSADFKRAWGAIGDSIVVVGGDGLWNCHIHTNDIGAAIEAPIALGGRPRQIRVTDLFEEVAEEHAAREATLGGAATHRPPASSLPPVTCAVVAVASGDGLAELFGQLGVHGVVSGGQTLNPSTAELLAAVEHMNAGQVIILPNNKNIIPVAQQVDELSSKEVRVVPTTSMPEALAALVTYDPEASAETNARNMSAAAASMTTGEVTQAVRDTATDAGAVTTGDWIGIVRGDGIVAVAGSAVGASTQLLDHIIDDAGELLTIVTGADATPSETDQIVAWLGDNRPDVAVEVHRGGQPLYPYLFGIE
ncbi:MAG: DAK2 domain-containing protein [Actinobacteria bacterium]|nr:DAK2 domain-containing protein [Actinomycetota bacterium]